MHLPDPTFPPLLAGHAVKAPERAFDVAVAGAEAGRYGAGDLVWGRDTARLDLAVVLEPEIDAERAAEMLPTFLVAVGDALGALVPPEVGVTFRWPAEIRVNGARAGAARMAMAPTGERPPAWLVVGASLDIRRRDALADSGLDPDRTDLAEEGCGEITRTELVEAIARHFLSWIDGWESEGFRHVHEALSARMEGVGERIAVEAGGERLEGRFAGIDEHGGMLLQTEAGTRLLRPGEVERAPGPVPA